MPLPKLDNAFSSLNALHRAMILTAPLSSALKKHLPNAQHLPLEIRPFGLRCQFPKGSSLVLNFKTAKLMHYRPNGIPSEFTLGYYSQKRLFEELLNRLYEDELRDYIPNVKENFTETFITKWRGGDSEKISAALTQYQDESILEIDEKIVADYGEVVYAIFTGIARFKARLNGSFSPLVIWAEHFDMSTVYFANPELDETKPHLNFGFAPYTEGKFENKPYLYAYAHPYPQGFTMPLLDEPMRWEHSAYHGIFVPYEAIARQEYPEQYVEQVCERMFNILHRVLV